MILKRGDTRKGWRVCGGGYTLIELMVALGLFMVVVSIAIGGFVSALRAQNITAALIAANSNVSLALEQMAREMRTGRNFCNPSCSSGTISFYNATGEYIAYKKVGDAIERGTEIGEAMIFQKLTGDNVLIRYLNFYLFRPAKSDEKFTPRITISIGISAKAKYVSSDVIRLQTTVSSRQLDG